MLRSRIRGVGSYLPAKILRNQDLAKSLETSDEWITGRTGIKQRHIAADTERTSDLAYEAAMDALKNSGMRASQIDMIVLATTTPDEIFPATAAKVQAKLGMTSGFAFDIQAVCSGFLYALNVADNFIRSGQVKTALVIGAETFSRIVDWNDRTTAILFGDGAGAVVLQADQGDVGIIGSILHSDGRYRDMLHTDASGKTRMQGKEVFKHAVKNLADVASEILAEYNFKGADIDWLIPHQANSRIIHATAEHLGVPLHKIIETIADHGNTSAASIPLAFATGVKDGRIKPGQLLLFEAMGGGFTWGASLAKF
ncbi:MAG: beta-ketoacyl-ACP synthase III [Dongiaceae bacterium]